MDVIKMRLFRIHFIIFQLSREAVFGVKIAGWVYRSGAGEANKLVQI